MTEYKTAKCVQDNYMTHVITLGKRYKIRCIPDKDTYMLLHPEDFYELINDKNLVSIALRYRFKISTGIKLYKTILK